MKEKMFQAEKIARDFAEHEQNEKNYNTSKVFDIIATNYLKEKHQPSLVLDLFAGAHPDRYHDLFKTLIKTSSKMHWVDNSPIMLKLAKEYLQNCKDGREKTITFIESDYLEYLKSCQDNSIDLVLIKYSLDYIKNFKEFFQIIYKKMKKNAIIISHITVTSNILKSHSTNAKYFFKGKPIPEGKEIILKDKDKFSIKFFKESGNPNSELIEGTETTKYFFSKETILTEAKSQGFKTFLGDWKNFEKENNFDFNLNILVLQK